VGGLKHIDAVQGIADGMVDFISGMATSTINFATSLAVQCDTQEDMIGDLCYEIGPRTLDLITPMIGLRKIAGHVAVIADNVCTAASAPLDMVLYPFFDINMAKGIHNVVNSLLVLLIQMPSITIARCAAHKSTAGVVMCLPDIEPVFNLFVSGVRYIGQGLDNWINVISIVVQKVIGMDVPTCSTIAAGFTAANYSKGVFGSQQISVVGLTKNLYSVTDGVHVEYFSHTNRFENKIMYNAFPMQIDTRLGLASVVYSEYVNQRDDTGSARTAMMGCR